MKKYILILFIAISQLAIGQTADFTYQTGNNTCLPIDVQFTQTSSGTPKGYLWDFGNGTRSNSANPIATYTSAGSYSVRLITVYENNAVQQIKTIVIHHSISANFTIDKSYLCKPGTVNFTASNSGDLANYVWDFGDASSQVTTTSNSLAHTYAGFGEFTITLKATSTSGCSVTSTRTIKVIQPQINGIISSALTGCVPATIDFSSSVSIPPGSSISNYKWEFGDGSSINSNSSTTSHVYGQVGNYVPRLSITTIEGCSSTFSFDSLAFGRPPTNNVAYPMDMVYCGSEAAQLVSKAPIANRYDWDFGGGSITSVSDTLISHKYNNLGTKNISVTPVFNGCRGTASSFQINIIGVIARYTYANTCNDKKTFVFNNTSQGHISTILWSLGNQAYSSSPQTVTHTYPASGLFNVKLLITDNITGCVDSFKTKIYTANPVLNNPDESMCINTDTHFTIANNYANPGLIYLWNVLGKEIGPTTEYSPIIHADSLGHFNSQVILNNGPQYCPDTIHLNHPITVRGPKLDFTMPESICLDVPLNVVNLSHPFQPSDTIKTWAWNFGRPDYNDSVFQPVPYQYYVSRPYPYRVKLTAIDIYGCQDSLVKKVNVRPMPFLWIIPKLDTLCQGQSSTLIGYTSDDILWTPANPNFCTTCDTTSVKPTETTKFYAVATNSFNCTATDSALVRVLKPFNATPLTPNSFLCAGEKTQLDVNPKDKKIVWSPADGLSNINIYNPVASPSQTTIYRATLTDSAGCFSSNTDIKITVKPLPVIDAGPNKVYPYNTNFVLTPTYGTNVKSFLWTPADSLSCATCAYPTGVAINSKTYTLIATSDSGCVARDNVSIFVECKGANIFLPAAFTPNNDGRNDFFHPITRGIKNITRFAVFNRQGQLVYEESNVSPNKETSGGWDGKFKGQDAAPAAYVYFVEAICDIGQTVITKGSFILIR